MQQPSGPAASAPGKRRRGRRGKALLRVMVEGRILTAAVPPGSRVKGDASFVMRDLILRPEVVRSRRERRTTPEGHSVTAPLPAGILGHFGPGLRRFVLAQYHPGATDSADVGLSFRSDVGQGCGSPSGRL